MKEIVEKVDNCHHHHRPSSSIITITIIIIIKLFWHLIACKPGYFLHLTSYH